MKTKCQTQKNHKKHNRGNYVIIECNENIWDDFATNNQCFLSQNPHLYPKKKIKQFHLKSSEKVLYI